MAFLDVTNVKVSGIVSCVPPLIISNRESPIFKNYEEADKFIKITGIREKRHVQDNVCTSDLCLQAAEKLINELQWNKADIDILVFVSQTPDYLAPNTSIILQDRLGIPKSCICFDVPLGCSGYVYGMAIVSQFLNSGTLKKGLLLVGDTLSRQSSPYDKSTSPLFGDAGTATAIEYEPNHKLRSYLWSNGEGYKSIIVPDGGYRNPLTQDSLKMIELEDGGFRSNINTYMNGSEVFSFGISEVPKLMNLFFDYFKIDKDSIDYYIFHQANKFMNEMIRKKLGIKEFQTPYSIELFGNTSSATIPLTISTLNQDTKNKTMIICGFGVGLSIGISVINLDDSFICDLIEYEE